MSQMDTNYSSLQKQAFQWIHVTINEEEDKLKEIANKYDLPPFIVDNAQDRWEVSRVEYWDRKPNEIPNLFVLQYPHRVKDNPDIIEYETLPITLIVFESTIITLTQEKAPFLHKNDRYRYMELETTDQEYFILSLVWNIGAEYLYCLEQIYTEINHLEDTLDRSTHTKQLYGMMALQKSLVFFESAVKNNHPVIKKLENLDTFTESEEKEILLKRVLVEIKQAEKTIDQTNKFLGQIGEVYSAAVGNNLNNIMKFLSSITIVLSLPSIIGAWWGMNVPVPFTENPFGFALLVAVSLVLVILGIWFFRKKDYL